MSIPLKKVIIPAVLVVALVAGVASFRAKRAQEPAGQGAVSGRSDGSTPQAVAEGLDTPWSLAFLPEDGGLLATERPGRIVFLKGTERKSVGVPGVVETGEGGLMGLVLHPDFRANRWLFVYYTVRENGRLENRITRYELREGPALTEAREILSGIPAGQNHNGGRIAFGPDGYLYVTVGDAGDSGLAQDRTSLAGKILRVKDDGGVPSDNPFGNPVYSYGHRNPQGLAWDGQGRLWATEHGRSGVRSGLDEINLVERGGNYGWPIIEGDEGRAGMIKPAVHSGQTTWAPSGLAYFRGKLYFAGLRGQALYQTEIPTEGGRLDQPRMVTGGFGRLRAVAAGPEGELYFSTSNRDGRGDPQAGDDRIVKLSV